jgi:hypothetical protein
VIQDGNLASIEIAEPLHKIKSKATEAIFVSYDNPFYLSLGNSFHQHEKFLLKTSDHHRSILG